MLKSTNNRFVRKLSTLTNPRKFVCALTDRGYLKFLPDKIVVQNVYKVRMGKTLNLDNPKTFNEKLQWLKFNDRNRRYSKLLDKYSVREYIEERFAGLLNLIPLLGVWNSAEEINFEELPNQFVLKCTHDSGSVIICKDKNKLNIPSVKKQLNKKLKKNYYYNSGREWPYKFIEPRIVCEELMVDDSGVELKDYKVMCFSGIPKCTFTVKNRKNGLNVDFYDLEWNLMPFIRKFPNSNQITSKPLNYDRMLKISQEICEEFAMKFVRVDFYEIDGKLYFGEITLYPGSGCEPFDPDEFDTVLGEWIQLS